ncbi:TPA: autotransporter outer membrane beta-barrel domain-containing protein [Citrobacter amalonaticus]|uniref:Autotransporter outer membrane beta-barrel domain-containing protein n=1 Tax=Citrobacter amalonaticus TaxID=35703 RepID=A0A9C7QI07_CITAM|nr:autotransporter outer membrane beta-barrel domain-containing protein [Citrobacter amalonaticus]
MKIFKYNLCNLAIASALLSTSLTSSAKLFCDNGNGQVWNKFDPVLSGELKNNECYEIGAYVDPDSADKSWTAKAENLTMLSGSKLSVMGYIFDSQVQNGAQLWIGKKGLIYSDPFQPGIPATGSGVDVQSGGLVYVINDGTLRDSFINGGRVNITSAAPDYIPGGSINNQVNAGGVLMVYSGGHSAQTTINDGGLEVLQMNGTSENTLINAGGMQYVTDDSSAVNTTVAGGIQYIFLSTTGSNPGVAENTVIKNSGSQIVQDGAQVFSTTLWDNGLQNIRAGSMTTNTTLHDSAISLIQKGAMAAGETIVNDRAQLQVVTGALDNTAAATKGAYIENVQLTTADSMLKIRAGEEMGSAFVDELRGQGQIRFDAGPDSWHSNLVIGTLSGSHTFWMNTSIAEKKSDFLTITQGSGEHSLKIIDSGAEITQPTENSLDLVADRSGGARFRLVAMDGTNINAVDGGTYMYTLQQRDEENNTIWYLSSQKEEKPQPEIVPPEEKPQPDPSAPVKKTTPSTDAVLSIASANQFIFDGELQSLRYRKGDLNSHKGKDTGVWGRYLTHNANINGKTGAAYKIQQNGFELGGDMVLPSASGEFIVGLFTSFTDNTLQHARGGNSKINSYGVGAYLTGFTHSGFYLDSVIKINQLQNRLNARMTSGGAVQSHYHQNAIGGTLEAGYHDQLVDGWFAEPYLRSSIYQAEGKDILLSNGMTANINKNRSLKAELGSTIGTHLTWRNGIEINPYFRVAVEREFIKSNKVTINKRNDFNNDFSGTSGKYGLGVDIRLSSQSAVYAEANYQKGQYVESPIMTNVGFRINF